MRKCWSCGTTKGLKQMSWNECSDEYCLEGRIHGCTCKGCFGELGCPEEHGIISDCISDSKLGYGDCPKAKEYENDILNWDKTDYYFKPKKSLTVFGEKP